MSFSDSSSSRPEQTVRFPVQLPNGASVKIEATRTGGHKDVSFNTKPLLEISEAIEGIVQAIAAPIQKVKPKKATIKFGLELAMESGQLAAIIVKGTSKANLEITLEWENPSSK